ncbi:MAG TPA: CPCC family cysteine-rich protein [Fimbriimonas sp.]|nr:CPCC family cysteine-rich protein [Fimbriimonas sp.]
MNYPCPCCGNRTLSEQPPGTYEICGVCFWEDDPVQFADPELAGGANEVSLNKAKENYLEFRVSDPTALDRIRPPQFG